MYIIGKTGAGKSTLIENMIISDINVEHGVALIDPHGDLAENILHFVPENRIQDVIYFNPADLGYSIAFNPLEEVHLRLSPFGSFQPYLSSQKGLARILGAKTGTYP